MNIWGFDFLDFSECVGREVVNRGVLRDILKTLHKKPDEVLLCIHNIWRTIGLIIEASISCPYLDHITRGRFF